MKYFSIEELVKSATAERLAIDNTPPRAAQRMLTILVEQLLDPIRRRYGAPIIVTSGYRCPALNTAVGGVANSHHMVGCAADITTGSIENNTMLFALIIDMQTTHAIRFTQLIAEKDYRWLHISYVPGMLRNQIIDVNACASERNASSLAIAQRQRERSVGCDEENFSSPEELRLVALQPSVCDEVTNDNDDDNHRPEGNHCEAQLTLVQTSEMQASLRFLSESSQVSMTKSLTSSLKKDEAKESPPTNDTS